VLNALPRRLPTAPGGRRPQPVPAPADNLGLVTSLINGTDPPDAGAETGVVPPYPSTVRGRARVVEAEDPDDYADRGRVVESTADVPHEHAGRAKVVEGTTERVVRGKARVTGGEPPQLPASQTSEPAENEAPKAVDGHE
jgi:hypothetical protein